MTGHDQYPEAEVRLFPMQEALVYPGVLVEVAESIGVIQQPDETAGADLLIIVAQAFDHHGNDVRELVANRIAEGLRQ